MEKMEMEVEEEAEEEAEKKTNKDEQNKDGTIEMIKLQKSNEIHIDPNTVRRYRKEVQY